MTVSGWTMSREERQSFQTWDSHAHRHRSTGVSLGRFTEPPQNSELVSQRDLLQRKCSSRFEGRRRGCGQYVKCAERSTRGLTEDTQLPYSHPVRYLR